MCQHQKIIMFRVLLISFLLLMLHASCRKTSYNGNGQVQLNHCMDKKFNTGMVTLCFDSLLTESRCPMHVTCVWQGYALGKFTFSEGGRTHEVELGTIDMTGISSKDTTISGYTLRLIDIVPYPGDVPVPVSARVEIVR
jgi:hypothetical protein